MSEERGSRLGAMNRRDFLESTIQTNTFDGKIYGVPWFTDAGCSITARTSSRRPV
ncbi:MAG: hypothetical protein ACRDJB_05085 [Actinomycetota bacterium]